MQDAQAQQTFLLEQVRKQAIDLGQATVAMPARVEQMSSTLSGLEGGEIKLRVRALEVERAARRASIMQVAPPASLASHMHQHFQATAHMLGQCSCHQTNATCHCAVQHLAPPYMHTHSAWLGINKMVSSIGSLFFGSVLRC